MLKPEHLSRAAELYARWMRLRDLEHAAHVNYSSNGRLKYLNVYGAGLKNTDNFDLSDLRDAGVDVGVVGAAVTSVVQDAIERAMYLVLDELRKLGVDADQMEADREQSHKLWKEAGVTK